jgi:hypothetical protein
MQKIFGSAGLTRLPPPECHRIRVVAPHNHNRNRNRNRDRCLHPTFEKKIKRAPEVSAIGRRKANLGRSGADFPYAICPKSVA